MRSRYWRRWFSVRRPERFWSILFLLVLLLIVVLRTASGQTESPPREQSSMEHLQKADDLLMQLESRLSQRPQQLEILQDNLRQARSELDAARSELAQLRIDLQKASGSQESLEKDLQGIQSSYEELVKKFDKLSGATAAYQQEMASQVLDLRGERDTWKTAGIIGWILALIAALIAVFT